MSVPLTMMDRFSVVLPDDDAFDLPADAQEREDAIVKYMTSGDESRLPLKPGRTPRRYWFAYSRPQFEWVRAARANAGDDRWTVAWSVVAMGLKSIEGPDPVSEDTVQRQRTYSRGPWSLLPPDAPCLLSLPPDALVTVGFVAFNIVKLGSAPFSPTSASPPGATCGPSTTAPAAQ